MWDELLMELRPWSECYLKALFLSRRQPPLNACGHSVYYKLIVPITSIAFVFPEFLVSPSKKFFLWRIQCRMSPKTAYFSYWSEMTHSAIFWLLVTWFLESAHFPASFPFLHYFCLKALSHECSYCSQQNILCLSWLKVFAPAVPSLFLLHLYNLT